MGHIAENKIVTSPKENRLSYWFPLIKEAGLPVPATSMVEMSAEAQEQAWGYFENDTKLDALERFVVRLADISSPFSRPFFLRTDLTSAKHDWRETCFVADSARLRDHVLNIIEFSIMCDLFGLPFDRWAVREILPTEPAFHAFRGEMPITEEWRAFVRGNELLCVHPYWPSGALRGHTHDPKWEEKLRALYENECPEEVTSLARAAGVAASEHIWSVDLLNTIRGFYVIDMALASMSWHSEECPNDFRL